MPIVTCWGCDQERVHKAHGLCNSCYGKGQYRGDPTGGPNREPITETIPHRDYLVSLGERCGGTFRFDRWYSVTDALMRCDRCRIAGLVPAVR